MEMDGPVRRPGAQKRANVIALRISDDGIAALDAMAEKEQRTRTDMIRILLRRGMEASR